MLRNTFVHLPGVGPKRERAFWEQGILDWDGFLANTEEGRLRGRVRRLDGGAGAAVGRRALPARRRLLQAALAAERVVAALLRVRRPGPVPRHRDDGPLRRIRRRDRDRGARRRQARPVHQGDQPRRVPGVRRPVPAPGQLQRQPVRRALPPGPFPSTPGSTRPTSTSASSWPRSATRGASRPSRAGWGCAGIPRSRESTASRPSASGTATAAATGRRSRN